MDFYKMRRVILAKITDYLKQREENIKKGLNPPPFPEFQRRLITEHGVTENMIRKMVESTVKDATVIDGEIVRKDAE